MKKSTQKPVILLLIISILVQNQGNMSFCQGSQSDYNVSNGDVFIWEFNDVDFVDNNYYIKFIIQEIYTNNSIIGEIERYYPFLNVSISETASDTSIINPKEEIYLLPDFGFFGLEFNQSIFVNTSQLQYYEESGVQTDFIKIVDQEIECFALSVNGKEIWIEKTMGVVVKVDYVKVYTLELVSWENVNLIEFAQARHFEDSKNSIYYILVSVAIAGLFIASHLMIRNYKKRKFLKKKDL
ncbi:hypothetical protein NEF87_001510 [Candidatus Lokiarchaeum ossiferum]|uniref:Uncharacterized protein n=1 Tax=Candidatus Lokiarchaeum ossiferum TaxID=2951803 RepID=A0ABY6HNX1_9ARCH|nr:hypothetical protein NEF87_001510 [Candidatus Lokiarchaeum sp. B-35]